MRLLTEPVPWPGGDRPRRAGISSFGVSGTNAHAILEEPPAEPSDEQSPAVPGVLGRGWSAWLVSARTAEGLAVQAARLREFAATGPESDPGDVGWSLATTRSVFEYRAVVTGGTREELAAGLAAVAAGEPAAGVVTGACAGRAGRAVFVFPGQGGQWAGMGGGAGGGLAGVRGAAGASAGRRWRRTWTGRWRTCWPGCGGVWSGWRWCSRRCGR